jgi:hypothetical protein
MEDDQMTVDERAEGENQLQENQPQEAAQNVVHNNNRQLPSLLNLPTTRQASPAVSIPLASPVASSLPSPTTTTTAALSTQEAPPPSTTKHRAREKKLREQLLDQASKISELEGNLDDIADHLNCVICHQKMRFPLSLQCGHSFCLLCIYHHSSTFATKVKSCPCCRAGFTKLPNINVAIQNCLKELITEEEYQEQCLEQLEEFFTEFMRISTAFESQYVWTPAAIRLLKMACFCMSTKTYISEKERKLHWTTVCNSLKLQLGEFLVFAGDKSSISYGLPVEVQIVFGNTKWLVKAKSDRVSHATPSTATLWQCFRAFWI